MKCRKGDYVTLKNGKTVHVIKGTNLERGWITVYERFDYGTLRVSRNAGEITEVRRYSRKWGTK